MDIRKIKKLIELVEESGIAELEITEGEELNFRSIDGMYSYCTRDNGEVVHLAAWTDVEIIKI